MRIRDIFHAFNLMTLVGIVLDVSVCQACVTWTTLVGVISDLGACQARFLNPWYNLFMRNWNVEKVKKMGKNVRNQKMKFILNPWYIIVEKLH